RTITAVAFRGRVSWHMTTFLVWFLEVGRAVSAAKPGAGSKGHRRRWLGALTGRTWRAARGALTPRPASDPGVAQALLTENHRDTEGARPEREVALHPGDAGHQRIDRSVEIRESVRVRHIVDEGSQRPCTELHPATYAGESGGVEHEIRR